MSNEKREEQIKEAARQRANQYDHPSKWSDTYYGFIDGAKWADSHHAWIPVEKELPKENEEVLAYNAENEEVIACDYHHKMFHCWPEVFVKSITHWMPMPTPPQGKEDKE